MFHLLTLEIKFRYIKMYVKVKQPTQMKIKAQSSNWKIILLQRERAFIFELTNEHENEHKRSLRGTCK
jgi:hypothetical protein